MAWVKTDDGLPQHPKMLRAGYAAYALWHMGLSYCNRNLTDGFLPTEALGILGPPVPNATKVAERLVEVGLWEKVNGGWTYHDYHDYQPSSEQVRELREKRAQAGKRGGQISRPPEKQTGSKPEANRKQVASPLLKQTGTPARPVPVREERVVGGTGENVNRESARARPRDVDPALWTAALALVDQLEAEGSQVRNAGGYARWLIDHRGDWVVARMDRPLPTPDVRKLLEGITKDMPEDRTEMT